VINTLNRGFAFSDQSRDNQADRGAQVGGHHRCAFEMGDALHHGDILPCCLALAVHGQQIGDGQINGLCRENPSLA
jgi:hypothetical protein